MRKTDKKIDKAIRQALTDACEDALDRFNGFQWLTHQVNYQQFPSSLKITCVFDTNQQLSNLKSLGQDADFKQLLKQYLLQINIPINDIVQHVIFDSEENCQAMNNGRWSDRLN